jgi:hypothetical protein
MVPPNLHHHVPLIGPERSEFADCHEIELKAVGSAEMWVPQLKTDSVNFAASILIGSLWHMQSGKHLIGQFLRFCLTILVVLKSPDSFATLSQQG